MSSFFFFNQDKAKTRKTSKRQKQREENVIRVVRWFWPFSPLSQLNDPEGDSQLRGFFFPSFLNIIQAGLVTQQFAHLDHRWTLGSSGGRQDRVKYGDQGAIIGWAKGFLSK